MGGMGNKELFYYFLGVLDTSKLDLNNGFLCGVVRVVFTLRGSYSRSPVYFQFQCSIQARIYMYYDIWARLRVQVGLGL